MSEREPVLEGLFTKRDEIRLNFFYSPHPLLRHSLIHTTAKEYEPDSSVALIAGNWSTLGGGADREFFHNAA